MNDKELIERLRDNKIMLPGGVTILVETRTKAADRLEALIAENEHLREATKMVPQWVSVAERLPEDCEDVLVRAYWHEAWQPMIGWYEPRRCTFSVTTQVGIRMDVAVTHWMPLPSTEEVKRMKKYHVASGDGKAYYGCGYESYSEAKELLIISQRHDPQAHIVEEEYHFTNADHIRAMTDEELADILSGMCRNTESCDFCPMQDKCPGGPCTLKPWIDWLQQPYESPTGQK